MTTRLPLMTTKLPPDDQFDRLFPEHGLRHSWRAAAAIFNMFKRVRDADGAEALLARLGDLGISPTDEQREIPSQAYLGISRCIWAYLGISRLQPLITRRDVDACLQIRADRNALTLDYPELPERAWSKRRGLFTPSVRRDTISAIYLL